MASIIISLAQMKISLGKPVENRDNAAQFIQQASQNGAWLVLFPELWNSGYDLQHCAAYRKNNLDTLKLLSQLAKQFQIRIGGSMLEICEDSSDVYNTFYFIDQDGKIDPVYRKIHLFPFMKEDLWLKAGNHLAILQLQTVKIGFAICYDLRFPEMFRHYTLNGVNLVLLPAEWPISRIQHWKTLLRARAIENQFFIAASNCVLDSGNEIFGGNSMVIDPRGEILAEAPCDKTGLYSTCLNVDAVDEARQQFPVLKDRRPDVYG
jgi:omega-amidase